MNKKMIIIIGVTCGILTGCVPRQKTYEMELKPYVWEEHILEENIFEENILYENILYENVEIENYS